MDERELVSMISQDDIAPNIIEIVEDIIERVLSNPQMFAANLRSEVDKLCEELDVCPKCGYNFELVKKYTEPRGEYFGSNAEETIYEYACEECGYQKD